MMRWGWLVLALWGTIHPMRYFIAWFQENGWSMTEMIAAWHVNDATSGLVWDLTIAAVTLTIWVIVDTIKTRHWRQLLAIPATFLIGVSCGLPLYLFLRSGRANKQG